MSDLERLGADVAEQQDAALAERDDLHAVRARLLATPARPKRAPLAWAIAAAAVAIAAIAWWARRPDATPRAIEYRVDGDSAPASTGRWISAQERMALSFSDGSHITLEPETDLRVTRLDSHGARVHLERGRATVAIVHRADTHWTIVAGPFEVRVVGTRFDVAWDPTTASFTLEMHRGVVEVDGPVIAERRVSGEEVVHVSLRERRTEIAQPVAPAPAPIEPPRALPTPPHPHTPTYDELARDGQYAEAVDAAVRAGWDHTLHTGSAASLLGLGDAARLSAQPDRAEQVYLSVRDRFAGQSSAARAAFALGRLYHDQMHRPADAARMFQTYLDESPGGSLAREAAGRLIEAERAAGHSEAARTAAQQYLQTYPEGPHAPLARSLIAQ